MTQVENLISLFKKSGLTETEWIQLDNLNGARLAYDENEVVVENEHGNFFPVGDLSNQEMEIFLLVIPTSNPKDALRAKLISCMNEFNEACKKRDAILKEAKDFINSGKTQKERDEFHNSIFDFSGSLLFRARKKI